MSVEKALPIHLLIPMDSLSVGQMAGKKGKKGAEPTTFFAILYYELLSSMNIRQQTVEIQAKELTENAAEQNGLNKQNGDVKFDIPTGTSQPEVQKAQFENEAAEAKKENIQNELVTTRMGGQMTMTQASANVSTLEQNAAADSGWIKNMGTIGQAINEMGRGQ